MEIKVDDLSGTEIRLLLAEHLQSMYEVSPAESVHALDVEALRRPEVAFWSVWEGAELAGCGALKELCPRYGEIKSMRTVSSLRGKGVASHLLSHLVREAKCRRYNRLYLETGTADYFLPARKLYTKFGFRECGPFEGYSEDPHSVFMMLQLNEEKL